MLREVVVFGRESQHGGRYHGELAFGTPPKSAGEEPGLQLGVLSAGRPGLAMERVPPPPPSLIMS